MDCSEYTPTSLGSPIEDLARFMENARSYGNSFDEVRMPADYYAKLTPDQIAWAEEEYHCKLKPIKPIVFKSKPTFRLPKDGIFKTSSPQDYGMSLKKNKRI